MQHQPRSRSDLTIRAAGLALAGAGGLAFAGLCRLANLPPRHPASVLEVALACAAFLGLAVGGALFTQGAGMVARVGVSSRWRASPSPARTHRAAPPPMAAGAASHPTRLRQAA